MYFNICNFKFPDKEDECCSSRIFIVPRLPWNTVSWRWKSGLLLFLPFWTTDWFLMRFVIMFFTFWGVSWLWDVSIGTDMFNLNWQVGNRSRLWFKTKLENKSVQMISVHLLLLWLMVFSKCDDVQLFYFPEYNRAVFRKMLKEVRISAKQIRKISPFQG